ncbi:tryptophan synthase subunit alpha [Atopobacter sp. AH10]|uniref:tryptophan synthase subunit alpha n=1 Tax=Atopobacter sp. AH10 TaxID=2315861 RepID=UPI000EF2634B|nr:tryptophan synthase subunit alpha [Atopobacter sp. AH10]RLK63438.1 tryptophan synthase subunit alpha [Atopobacter sp. AH10]
MSHIKQAFQNKKAFIPFITCGDPDLETSRHIILEAVKNGASLIELGIPFSDPTAEGPVIQAANIRALENGITTTAILDFVKELRKEVTIPLVFMTYANVVYSYGIDRFLKACQEAKMDGLILADVPYEEKEEFQVPCQKYGLSFISLIAPTSKDRIKMIAKEAEGFIYVVSSLGVTGERENIQTDLKSMISEVRQVTDLPCAIGFGISTPDQAKEMAKLADGVIVGSAVVKRIGQNGQKSPRVVGKYIQEMTSAIAELKEQDERSHISA